MSPFHPQDPLHRRLRHAVNPHLEDRTRKTQGVLIAVGLALIILVIVAVWSYLSSDSTQDLLLNVVSLRKGTSEVVKRSALISQTNKLVLNMGNRKIQSEWDSLAECMSRGCTDIDYFNFIVTVITQKKVPNSELLYNIILTNKFAGTDEIVDFSQAVTMVNERVETLASREVSKKWNEIVQCLQQDKQCTQKDDLFFQMIKLVVMAS